MKTIKLTIPTRPRAIEMYCREGDGADSSVLTEMFIDNVYRLKGYMFTSPRPIVVDVGANIGAFTLQALLQAYDVGKRIKVFAVEPEKENLELLEKNLAANSWLFDHGSEVVIVRDGISDFNGTSHITSASGNSRLSSGEDLQEISVVTYDQFIADNNIGKIDFVKIDIEGSEIGLIKSASQKNLLKAHYYAIEWDESNENGSLPESLKPFMSDFSFETWGIPNVGCNIYLENHNWG